MKPETRGHGSAGTSLIELIVALAVVGAAATMLAGLTLAARRTALVRGERQLAGQVAGGAFERLRGRPPGELPGPDGRGQPLPEEAGGLRRAELVASARNWPGGGGLRHLRVTVRWDSRAGGRRELVREGLVSDARAR